VTGDHTISATFARKILTVTSEASAGGTITPLGATVVNCGDNQAYTITAAPGFFILDIFIDFVSIGAITNPTVMIYDFTNITRNHTIRAFLGRPREPLRLLRARGREERSLLRVQRPTISMPMRSTRLHPTRATGSSTSWWMKIRSWVPL